MIERQSISTKLQLSLTTLIVVMFGIALPFTPIAPGLGFTQLPWLYWPILLGIMALYMILTQLVKGWFIRKFGQD